MTAIRLLPDVEALILYSDKPLDFRFLILLLLAKNLKYLNQNFEVFFYIFFF